MFKILVKKLKYNQFKCSKTLKMAIFILKECETLVHFNYLI